MSSTTKGSLTAASSAALIGRLSPRYWARARATRFDYASLRGEAPVGHQDRPGDDARARRDQERDHLGDLLGPRQPTEGMLGRDRLEHGLAVGDVGQDLIHEAGVDVAGRHRVD